MTDGWEEVFATTDATELMVVEQLLSTEAIPVRRLSSRVSQLPLNTNGLGQVRLIVPAEFAERARALLEEMEAGDDR